MHFIGLLTCCTQELTTLTYVPPPVFTVQWCAIYIVIIHIGMYTLPHVIDTLVILGGVVRRADVIMVTAVCDKYVCCLEGTIEPLFFHCALPALVPGMHDIRS